MIFKKTVLPIAPQSDKRTRLAFVARLHKQLLSRRVRLCLRVAATAKQGATEP